MIPSPTFSQFPTMYKDSNLCRDKVENLIYQIKYFCTCIPADVVKVIPCMLV